MSGLDRALKDVEEGRVYRAESVEDMFKQILSCSCSTPAHILIYSDLHPCFWQNFARYRNNEYICARKILLYMNFKTIKK